jgi:hypothetical protein
MARRTSHANLRVPADDEEEEEAERDGHDGFGYREEQAEEAPPVRRAPAPPPVVVVPVVAADASEGDGEDLTARTRRSMAGFEAARQKAQLDRRRSLRKGKQQQQQVGLGSGDRFPAVDEEGAGDDTTLLLAEELMGGGGGGGEDYEAVFMSRPKLKTSPVGTPVRELWRE